MRKVCTILDSFLRKVREQNEERRGLSLFGGFEPTSRPIRGW